MKKASEYRYLEAFVLSNGRCERIRTFDPLHPMQVRYQAAPHTEAMNYILRSETIFRYRVAQRIKRKNLSG
jgi:hypothetical protein